MACLGGTRRPGAPLEGPRPARVAQPRAALAAGRPRAGLRHAHHARRPGRRRSPLEPAAPRGRRGPRARRVAPRPPPCAPSPRCPTGSAATTTCATSCAARGRERRAARPGRAGRLRPQPARRVRRPDRRRGRPRLRPGAGPRRRRWVRASRSSDRDHRRRLRRRARPRHDRGQQRRPGRPGAAGHPHAPPPCCWSSTPTRWSAAGSARAWRSASSAVAASLGEDGRLDLELVDDADVPARGDTRRHLGQPRRRPTSPACPIGTVDRRSTARCASLPARGRSSRSSTSPPSTWSASWCPAAPESDRAVIEADGSLR